MSAPAASVDAKAANREDGAAPTAAVANYAAGLAYETLPAATVEATKKLLLDGIGCLIAGTRGQPGRLAADAYAPLVEGGKATIIIDAKRASARDAAFVNGITLYSVGVNDIHKPSGAHPGGCVVPTVLAVGEWLASPGRDLIAAMVAGYDVIGRLGRAMIPSHRERGFHPTGTFGTFGATAAAGRLLALDPARMTAALGIAGSQAAGLKAFHADGSLTMIYHAGHAAQNGVEAALLAGAGFTGPSTVFEDRHGFVAATADRYDMAAITADLGRMFEVEATTFRPYYGCTLTITASGSAAAVMKRRLERGPDDVAAIVVRGNPAIQEVDHGNPRTLLEARLSMQFNLALVVERGGVWVGDVTEEDLHSAVIRRLMPLVAFDYDASLPRYGTEVTIRFKDGSEARAGMISPKGDPDNPMSWEDTQTKFLDLVAPIGRAAEAEAVARLVHALEDTDGATLVRAITAAAGTRA